MLEMIYACEQRQDWFRGYVRSNDWSELPFVGSMTPDTSVITAALGWVPPVTVDEGLRRVVATGMD